MVIPKKNEICGFLYFVLCTSAYAFNHKSCNPSTILLGYDEWRLNYCQTQFRLLHSGAIPEIDRMNRESDPPTRGFNTRVRVPNTNPFFNDQHSSLPIDAAVWANVGAWVEASVDQ